MSKKHFDEYYTDLLHNYLDMVSLLEELEKSCNKQMVEPERVEQYKQTLEPVKEAFLSAQYIKYLLDKPAKKCKQGRYEQVTKKIDKKKFQDSLKNNRDMIGGLLK